MPHVNKKPLARKGNQSEKIRSKKSKSCKNQNEIDARKQKNHLRESDFLFKGRFLTLHKISSTKISRRKTTRFFAPLDQNHYSNLTSKIMKMCEQIFKKRQRTNTIQILSIVKKRRAPKW